MSPNQTKHLIVACCGLGPNPRTMNLANNLLSGLPSEVGQLTSMVYDLSIKNNPLEATIPSQIGQLTSLTSALLLGSTSLSGTVPTQLSQLGKAMASDLDLRSKNSPA